MAHLERVIILIDMDCFYCQVEEKLDPNLEGKPIAVVQYNQWRGGGIIAVNYPARDKGVTRQMRGEDAKEKCPDIILASVPQVRGKADLSKYRDAGKRVADVLQTFTNLLERASIDEAYLDVTDLVLNRMKNGVDQISVDKLKNTFVVGCDTKDFMMNISNQIEFSESDFKLCLGGIIAEEIRSEVFRQTGYKCSAGIAHNKILAKLVCGMHKPNKQTILPHDAVQDFFKTLPLRKVKSLGGKFGKELSEDLSISTMGELANFSERQLVEKFGKKNGLWLYNIAKGIDFEPVVTRLISKSIGCCKRFPGKTALTTHEAIQHWMNELATEIAERLEKDLLENNRRAKQMIVSFGQEFNNKSISNSRTCHLNSYEQAQIAQGAVEVVRKACQKSDGSYKVVFLGISVSNFQGDKKNRDIASFFKKTMALQEKKLEEKIDESMEDDLGNVSIYSASTDDLEEDPKSYIYFEDIYPECVSSQPLDSYHKNDSLVVQESDCKTELEIRRKSSKSFFDKYFDGKTPNSETKDAEEFSVAKNDVSHLETSNAMDILSDNQEKDVKKRKSSETNIIKYFPKCEQPNENYCKECKRNIPMEEVFDHSDYHVAKKLQAQLNSSNKMLQASSSVKIKSKTKKATNVSIANYFKPM